MVVVQRGRSGGGRAGRLPPANPKKRDRIESEIPGVGRLVAGAVADHIVTQAAPELEPIAQRHGQEELRIEGAPVFVSVQKEGATSGLDGDGPNLPRWAAR